MLEEDWKIDWTAFSREVARLIDKGYDNDRLSERFGGQTVRWIGVASDVQTNAEYAAGVALSMPRVEEHVRGKYKFVAEYAFAGTTPESGKTWSDVNVGDEVEFECKIGAPNGVFAGLKVSIFDEEKECFLEVSLSDASLRRVVAHLS